MKRWVVPEHSNKAVQRASRVVGKGSGTSEEIQAARDVLSNYRLAHAFPLNAVTVTVRQRALNVNQNAVVAERRKRLPTVTGQVPRSYDLTSGGFGQPGVSLGEGQ